MVHIPLAFISEARRSASATRTNFSMPQDFPWLPLRPLNPCMWQAEVSRTKLPSFRTAFLHGQMDLSVLHARSRTNPEWGHPEACAPHCFPESPVALSHLCIVIIYWMSCPLLPLLPSPHVYFPELFFQINHHTPNSITSQILVSGFGSRGVQTKTAIYTHKVSSRVFSKVGISLWSLDGTCFSMMQRRNQGHREVNHPPPPTTRVRSW